MENKLIFADNIGFDGHGSDVLYDLENKSFEIVEFPSSYLESKLDFFYSSRSGYSKIGKFKELKDRFQYPLIGTYRNDIDGLEVRHDNVSIIKGFYIFYPVASHEKPNFGGIDIILINENLKEMFIVDEREFEEMFMKNDIDKEQFDYNKRLQKTLLIDGDVREVGFDVYSRFKFKSSRLNYVLFSLYLNYSFNSQYIENNESNKECLKKYKKYKNLGLYKSPNGSHYIFENKYGYNYSKNLPSFYLTGGRLIIKEEEDYLITMRNEEEDFIYQIHSLKYSNEYELFKELPVFNEELDALIEKLKEKSKEKYEKNIILDKMAIITDSELDSFLLTLPDDETKISKEMSIEVGNCEYGTDEFIKKYNLGNTITLSELKKHKDIEEIMKNRDFRRILKLMFIKHNGSKI